jgi:Fe-S cluster biogenesis protein NfuA
VKPNELDTVEWPPNSSIYFAKDIPMNPYDSKKELDPVEVNKALDEIRPYIEADGGYLEFVEVDYIDEGPVVKGSLHGACSTCVMSTQTLKMGIEKHIQNLFPEVYEVIQVL